MDRCPHVVEDQKNNKEELEQMRNAEKKFQALIQRRNELNDLAKLMREERDMLNTKRNDLRDQINTFKKERDELVEKMKEHKNLRNQYQEQAKALIKAKSAKKGEVIDNLPIRCEELKADIQMLEYRQETTPLSPRKEKDLIDEIKTKRKDYLKAKKDMEKQKLIKTDLSDTDNAITELFKKADEEHEKVQTYYKQQQEKHKKYVELVNEVSTSISEANKRHKKYLEIREEAQEQHEKAMEMRDKVMAVKNERRKRYQEAKALIKEQNKKAKTEIFDDGKLEKVADKSLESLKKGSKISF